MGWFGGGALPGGFPFSATACPCTTLRCTLELSLPEVQSGWTDLQSHCATTRRHQTAIIPDRFCSCSTEPRPVPGRPNVRFPPVKGTVHLKLSVQSVFGGQADKHPQNAFGVSEVIGLRVKRPSICSRFQPVKRAFACHRCRGVCRRGFRFCEA